MLISSFAMRPHEIVSVTWKSYLEIAKNVRETLFGIIIHWHFVENRHDLRTRNAQ